MDVVEGVRARHVDDIHSVVLSDCFQLVYVCLDHCLDRQFAWQSAGVI